MNADQFIAARVSSETKARLRALAERQALSESGLLKRFVELMLQAAGTSEPVPPTRAEAQGARAARLMIRLRADDQMFLRERASARSMAPATYVSVLVRSHLRSLVPLPKEELLALRKAVAELGGVGRNLNQIARAANQGERVSGPGRQDVQAMIRICEGLRDHVRGLLAANLRSWEQGYVESDR